MHISLVPEKPLHLKTFCNIWEMQFCETAMFQSAIFSICNFILRNLKDNGSKASERMFRDGLATP